MMISNATLVHGLNDYCTAAFVYTTVVIPARVADILIEECVQEMLISDLIAIALSMRCITTIQIECP